MRRESEVQSCAGAFATGALVKGVMSKPTLSSSKASVPPYFCPHAPVVVYLFLLSALAIAGAQTSPTAAPQKYVPPELQAVDPNVKAYLDSTENSAKLGNDGECLTSLQKALELATKQKSLADKGLVEDTLAVYYFTQGKLEDAKSQWVNPLSDGMAVSNAVLQADVLVALATLQQTSGHLDQAMKTVNQALDLSRKSKSLYLESRVLGELSRLQLLAGKQTDARVSIEEALQIDRVNRYSWEAGHLLYLAWVNAAESKVDKAIEFATSARDLAVKNENYLTYIQASEFLGQAFVHTGRTDAGIRTLQLARKGESEQGKSLFQSPDGYSQAGSRPYLKTTFLESLGLAYEAANRPDEALKSWQDMYDAGRRHAGERTVLEADYLPLKFGALHGCFNNKPGWCTYGFLATSRMISTSRRLSQSDLSRTIS
jgi:tetratricopeptide (TPR) repeat protein